MHYVRRLLFPCAVLILVGYVFICEYRQPTPDRWWRRVAELGLTEVSSLVRSPIGARAAEVAFELRQHLSSDETLLELTRSAQRHGKRQLGAVAGIYLARRGLPCEGESLRLIEQSFQMEASQLTAWQYSSCLRRNRLTVPESVDRLLRAHGGWEYSELLSLDARPEAISAAVRSSAGEIRDSQLLRLAELATSAERTYAHWSQPVMQASALSDLRNVAWQLAPIAGQHRGIVFIESTIEVFVRRTFEGLTDLLWNPGPIEIGVIATKAGRRLATTVDAVAAVGAAADRDAQIVKAREALVSVETQIYALESGQMVREMRDEVDARRREMLVRLSILLSDPRRYQVDADLVLAAIEGQDVDRLFLRQTEP